MTTVPGPVHHFDLIIKPTKPNICINCSRKYKLKYNYDRHVPFCNLLYSNRREREAEADGREKIPSQQELLKIVQELVIRCNKLENDVHKLQQTGNNRQKKNIVEWLKKSPAPSMTVSAWFQSIVVTDANLDIVFSRDFTEGIKSCIQSTTNSSGNGNSSSNSNSSSSGNGTDILPVRAFSQKSNTLYVYTTNERNQLEWSILSNEFLQKMIADLSHKFLLQFIKWQNTNQEQIDGSETMKEQHIVYMSKITGARATNEKRSLDIKKWLCQILEPRNKSVVEIDFV
jgi:hypothetical protein